MFLNNANYYFAGLLGISGLGHTNKPYRPMVNTNGKNCDVYYAYFPSTSYKIHELCKKILTASGKIEGSGGSYDNYVGVMFGTGNTKPSSDDYWLSGERVSGLSSKNVTYTVNRSNDEAGSHYEIIYTISNTTDADITIGEIALIDALYRKISSSSSQYWDNYMMERTSLDSPVTIPSAGVGQVTYRINMKWPTFA